MGNNSTKEKIVQSMKQISNDDIPNSACNSPISSNWYSPMHSSISHVGIPIHHSSERADAFLAEFDFFDEATLDIRLRSYVEYISKPHENIINILNVARMNSVNDCSISILSQKLIVLVEHYTNCLAEQLFYRSDKQPYPEETLWKLLKEMLAALSHLQKYHNLPHQAVSSDRIFIAPNGSFKLIHPAMIPPSHLFPFQIADNFRFHNNYHSPNLYKKDQKPPISSSKIQSTPNTSSKHDVFSLGMTLLHMGTLRDLNECYQFNKQNALTFVPSILQSRLAEFQSKYSKSLFEIVSTMVEIDLPQRPSLEQIQGSISQEILKPLSRITSLEQELMKSKISLSTHLSNLNLERKNLLKEKSKYDKMKQKLVSKYSILSEQVTKQNSQKLDNQSSQTQLKQNNSQFIQQFTARERSQREYRTKNNPIDPHNTQSFKTACENKVSKYIFQNQYPQDFSRNKSSSRGAIEQQENSLDRNPEGEGEHKKRFSQKIDFNQLQANQINVEQPINLTTQIASSPSELQPDFHSFSIDYSIRSNSMKSFSNNASSSEKVNSTRQSQRRIVTKHQKKEEHEDLLKNFLKTHQCEWKIYLKQDRILQNDSMRIDKKKDENSNSMCPSTLDNQQEKEERTNQDNYSISFSLISDPTSKQNTLTASVSNFLVEEYADGSRYEGMIQNGHREGEGSFFFLDGSKYVGQWSKDYMEGLGCLFNSDGKVAYDGLWKGDKFHGFGVLFNQNLSKSNESQFDCDNFDLIDPFWIKYEGCFVDDMKQGFGSIHFLNGSRFEGYFYNDFVEGEGILFLADGSKISAEWRQNKRIKAFSS